MDALTMKVREAGRTVNVHALVAVGVNADGQREVLGLDVTSNEDGAGWLAFEDGTGWLAFLRSLTARGLSGVRLVISDARPRRRLVQAIGAALPGASWQRCRTHYLRNLLTTVPKSARSWITTLVRTIFDQPDTDAVRAQFQRSSPRSRQSSRPPPNTSTPPATTSSPPPDFPRETWRQIWSNNPQERLNKEVRRRTDVVGILPNQPAIIRLVGAARRRPGRAAGAVRRLQHPSTEEG